MLYVIMYVNDLLSHLSSENVDVIMYAYDTVLLTSDQEQQSTVEKMQRAIESLCNWCYANKLTVNLKKIQHLLARRTGVDLRTYKTPLYL